jgi:hypothetical protein
MTIKDNISGDLVGTLSGLSHSVALRDKEGRATVNAEDAVYLYIKDKATLILVKHDIKEIEIWYDPNEADIEWIKNEVKPRATTTARRYLYSTTTRSYDGEIRPKDFVHRTRTDEARNTSKSSYHPLGETKIIIRHSKKVDEEKRGARSRNIQDVFIEHKGERFRYPHKHLLGARVMALHVDQGGKPWDQLGEKIAEVSRRRTDIMELLRYSKKINNSVQLEEIQSRGYSEVKLLRRMMERAARTGKLDHIVAHEFTPRQEVSESIFHLIQDTNVKLKLLPGLEIIRPQGLVSEQLDIFTKNLI